MVALVSDGLVKNREKGRRNDGDCAVCTCGKPSLLHRRSSVSLDVICFAGYVVLLPGSCVGVFVCVVLFCLLLV